MTKIKKRVLILIVLSILLIPILYVAFAWTLVSVGSWLFAPTPSKPQISYSEFPFELVCEIDGTVYTFNDVYVCEYEGIERDESGSKYRKWNGYIKTTGYGSVLLLEDDDRKIFCDIGYPEYYMSDYIQYQVHGNKYDPITPRIYDQEKRAGGGLSESELMKEYNIKIISWNFSDPIDNSFD